MYLSDHKRLNYVDSAKGIGIILVVIGHHILDKPELILWINSFHMPLFFIITGWLDYLHNEDYSSDLELLKYFKKKARSLLWPYCTFCVVNYLWIAVGGLFFRIRPEEPFLIVWIKMITTYGYQALWFLPVMFWASVINRYAGKIAPRMTLVISLIFGSCISIYLEYFTGLEVFRNILIYVGRVSVAVSFIIIGRVLCYFLDDLRLHYAITLACICFAIHLVLFRFIQQPNMSLVRLSNIPMFYLLGCAGSISVLLLCKYVPIFSNSRLLTYAGHNALIIMGLHMGFPIELAWIALGMIGATAKLSIFGASVVAVGIECLILGCCILLIHKFAPFLLRFPAKK